MSLFVVIVAVFGVVKGWEGSWFGEPTVLNENGEPMAMCHMTNAYPPPANRSLETFVIDLDANAADRWTEPTTKYKDMIVSVVELTIGAPYMFPFREMVDKAGVDSLLARLPNDWGDEITSIAKIIAMSKTDVFLYNLAYALMGFCTSIVTEDNNGNIFHGRNLDFGLWPAVNWTDWQWDLTTDLKEILFMVNFTKNGEVLYQTVTYGGFIGVHTGMKTNVMTLSVDTRFDDNYDKYITEWIEDPTDTNELLVMTTRYVLENQNSYSDAITYLKTVPMVCPAYIIVGGLNAGEGVVLSYGPNMTLFDEWGYPNGMTLPQNNTAQSPFYILETNYDHWDQPPFYDDRRYPAEDCM
eukprot:277154_1